MRAFAAVLLLVAGCTAKVSYDDTRFRCADGACPAGYECVAEQCVPEGSAIDAALPAGFRRPITVTASLEGTLAGAPVLVALDASRIDYARAAAGGADLRFEDDAGEALPHEIERWDPAGTSLIWVRLPALASGTVFFMIYGEGGAATERAADVWSGYQQVYHLAGDATDSTGGFDAKAQSGAAFGSSRLGDGAALDGVDDYYEVGSDLPLLRQVSAVTMSAWVHPEVAGGSVLEISINGGLSSRTFLGTSDTNLAQLGVRSQDMAGASLSAQSAEPLPLGEWSWVLGTADFAAGTVTIYVDGALSNQETGLAFDPATPDTNSMFAVIAADEALGSGFFDGSLDEVRCAPTAVDAAWVQAQYLSMTDALLSFGAEEPLP